MGPPLEMPQGLRPVATILGRPDHLHPTTAATELLVVHPPPDGLLYFPG